MKIMGIGAHYDDCIFGIPGILLRAVDQGHEVTILSVIGDYKNWSPVGTDRQEDMLTGTTRLFEEQGLTLKFLNYQSIQWTFCNKIKPQKCSCTSMMGFRKCRNLFVIHRNEQTFEFEYSNFRYQQHLQRSITKL